MHERMIGNDDMHRTTDLGGAAIAAVIAPRQPVSICSHCHKPESDVGKLTYKVRRTHTGVVGSRECAGCAAIDTSEEITGHTLKEFVEKLHAASACARCGKSTTVANVNFALGKRGVVLEIISPDVHCTCPGGIAHAEAAS